MSDMQAQMQRTSDEVQALINNGFNPASVSFTSAQLEVLGKALHIVADYVLDDDGDREAAQAGLVIVGYVIGEALAAEGRK